MYLYIYIYVCKCIHTCMHIYIYVYFVYIYIYLCIYKYFVYVRMYACMYVCMFVCVCTRCLFTYISLSLQTDKSLAGTSQHGRPILPKLKGKTQFQSRNPNGHAVTQTSLRFQRQTELFTLLD